jgi:hypothetical protein
MFAHSYQGWINEAPKSQSSCTRTHGMSTQPCDLVRYLKLSSARLSVQSSNCGILHLYCRELLYFYCQTTVPPLQATTAPLLPDYCSSTAGHYCQTTAPLLYLHCRPLLHHYCQTAAPILPAFTIFGSGSSDAAAHLNICTILFHYFLATATLLRINN